MNNVPKVANDNSIEQQSQYYATQYYATQIQSTNQSSNRFMTQLPLLVPF